MVFGIIRMPMNVAVIQLYGSQKGIVFKEKRASECTHRTKNRSITTLVAAGKAKGSVQPSLNQLPNMVAFGIIRMPKNVALIQSKSSQ